jgi:hypothetical protein
MDSTSVLQAIRGRRRHARIIWTPTTLLHCMGTQGVGWTYPQLLRRRAKRILERLCDEGHLIRRPEIHSVWGKREVVWHICCPKTERRRRATIRRMAIENISISKIPQKMKAAGLPHACNATSARKRRITFLEAGRRDDDSRTRLVPFCQLDIECMKVRRRDASFPNASLCAGDHVNCSVGADANHEESADGCIFAGRIGGKNPPAAGKAAAFGQ